mmetsp:Transcript_14576/g.43816  ORF Transcript_14576/g.43816 Transcript_14576/m.43816 type:complete len:216 (-) Transcript_14576:1953-2600(-)
MPRSSLWVSTASSPSSSKRCASSSGPRMRCTMPCAEWSSMRHCGSRMEISLASGCGSAPSSKMRRREGEPRVGECCGDTGLRVVARRSCSDTSLSTSLWRAFVSARSATRDTTSFSSVCASVAATRCSARRVCPTRMAASASTCRNCVSTMASFCAVSPMNLSRGCFCAKLMYALICKRAKSSLPSTSPSCAFTTHSCVGRASAAPPPSASLVPL